MSADDAGGSRGRDESATPPPAGTVLRAFNPDAFEHWPAWERLKRALAGNGGSYGLVGPRGSGKTWQMQMAVNHARAGGIGLWYPSPSEYDSAAFLISLTDTFAREVQGRKRRVQSTRYWLAVPVRQLAQVGPAVLMGAYFGVGAGIL